MVTEKQLTANRQNALKSTGPRTIDGKAKASKNAITHGLLGSEVLPLELGGLRAGRTTRGHRFLNPRGDFDLERAELDHYRETLRKRRVLVDPLERRELEVLKRYVQQNI